MKFGSQLASEIYAKVRSSAGNVSTSSIELSEIVLNIAEGCNLTCSYCFANEGLYSADSPSWMSQEHAYQYTKELLRSRPTTRRIKLFGGEPFTNIPALTGFVQALEEHWASNPDLRNLISVGCVTNMTIYSGKIADLIKRADIRVTASIDGPQSIHDENRRFRSGRGSFNKVLSVAGQYAAAGIPIDGVECVYSPAHQRAGIAMADLHEFILSILNPRRVILTPLQASLPDKDPEQVAFAEWIRETAFDYLRECVKRANEHSSYRALVEDHLALLFSPKANVGWCALGRSTWTITSDGAVVPCYTLLNNRDEWTMGRMTEGSFIPSKRELAILRRLRQATPRLHDECDACDIREVCRGCPGAVYSQKGVLTGRDLVACNFCVGALEGLIEGWGSATVSR